MPDWKSRADVLADPEHSDAVKRAMMVFWLASDRQEMDAAIKRDARVQSDDLRKPTTV